MPSISELFLMWKFDSILKPTIWGGRKITDLKMLTSVDTPIGESWEISGVPGSLSVVCEGSDKGLSLFQLVDKYGANLLGNENFKRFGNNFPLLVKLIDASDNLSVQVHPSDDIARSHGHPIGKSEMWYILQTEPDAVLANGFKRPILPADFSRLIDSGDIEDCLRISRVAPGEAYFIPAGRVHSIGRGTLLIEIQQTSDITYRIYDYHRKDKDGKERQLHVDLASQAVNFNDTEGSCIEYISPKNGSANILHSPFFSTDVINLDSEISLDYTSYDSFLILVATKGEVNISAGNESCSLSAGFSVLIPACTPKLKITPKDSPASLLAAYITH
ncbi:MAG: class I mannose-6-phosphate isomerase [Clostridium sp.]|nr:class I mannose-6-phosphate isomerase [Prevotella sp.]MCM1429495.1 class I mannose-6-phosphate isomerase [Clostridium sp.]MCM1476111.1 class I mannose-6-phosphate isomerase [Muribaculaceae bacterium]